MKAFCGTVVAFVIIALFASAFAGEAGVEGMRIRADRPRIWLTPERVEALKAKYEKDPANRAISGNSPGASALRWVLTGSKDDARTAIDYIMKFDLSDEVLFKDVASDRYRWEAMIPVIYDWCHDEMTAKQRSEFLARYGRIVTLMNKKYWGGPQIPGNNYYAGYTRNSGIFGLAAFKETPYAAEALRDAFVTRWENASLPYYENGARGGLTGEGTQYGRYSVGYMTWLAEAARTAAGRNLWRETNWFREFAYQTIYSTTPAPTHVKGSDAVYYQRFPFGDDQFTNGHPAVREVIGDSMRAVAREYAGEKLAAHAARYIEMVKPPTGLFGWVIEDGLTKVEPKDFSDLPLDYYLPGPGYAYLRSGWGTDATAIMLQLGIAKKSDHHHLDLGSFQIVRGGWWLSKESTGYLGEEIGLHPRRADMHNTLLFDGRGQAGGHLDGPPKIRAIESNEKFFHAVTGMTAAYRAQESPKLQRDDNPSAGLCVREFLFIRPDLLIIFDRMKSTAPDVKKTFVLHLPAPPKAGDGQTFTMVNGQGRLVAQFVYPRALGFNIVDEGDFKGKKSNPAYYQYRLEANQSGQRPGWYLTVLAAQERFDMAPRCELVEKEGTIGVNIDQPGRRVEVAFNKAMSDHFGHLKIESAGAEGFLEEDLLEIVQPIEVTADGPKWGSVPKMH